MRGADWKKSELESIAVLARESPVVGVASIHEIPASLFQSIRRSLRGKVRIRVSKKTLILQAFAKSGRERIEDLRDSMEGEVALLFTDMNPFKLFRYLEDGKVRSRAKPGHKPPEDVWVPKGQTPFAPGPMVAQLQKAGIPARIERGKVVILEDTLLVKAGQQIDRSKAEILAALGIEPMKVGLHVRAVYEDRTVFRRPVLDVDQAGILRQVALAAGQAFNLGFNARYPTRATIIPLLQDAHRKARSLSIEAFVPTGETIGDLLAKAQRGMMGVAHALIQKDPGSVGEALKGMMKAANKPESTVVGGENRQNEGKSEAPQAKDQKEEEGAGLGALFG